jgi:hypothetical protein
MDEEEAGVNTQEGPDFSPEFSQDLDDLFGNGPDLPPRLPERPPLFPLPACTPAAVILKPVDTVQVKSPFRPDASIQLKPTHAVPRKQL